MNTEKPERFERLFQGNGVSPGLVLGRALKLDSHNRMIFKSIVGDEFVEEEVKRVQNAIRVSREQLEALKVRLEEKVGPEHSFILDAHILMLEDRMLLSDIISEIRTNHANAQWAVRLATDKIREAYHSLDDEYFRERVSDVEDVVERILLNLSGDKPLNWSQLPRDLILVSYDFNPSAFATMDLEKVRGLALESGGRTSHTAIISRSLRLPAVMEIPDLVSSISTGDLLLLNGDEGQLIVNPDPDRLQNAQAQLEKHRISLDGNGVPHGSGVVTRDNVPLSLRANTELPHEVEIAKKMGAEGIGLFRSEFLFFSYSSGFPSMEDQLGTYRRLAEDMAPHPVSVRTLDAGGDKMWFRTDSSSEQNPSMGLRGIRLSLQARELFSAQIEAILRAASFGKMEIVLPMVSTLEEIRRAKEIIRQVSESIGGDAPFVPVGAMIEVPAAVLTLEKLAGEVDFLCVGTNDLIQYLLAVDRNNPNVSHLFQPLHPSVLQCLKRIAEVARTMKKPVRICGEISSNPIFAILLLGMGYTHLSMNPRSIPAIRKVLHGVTTRSARKLLKGAMNRATSGEVFEFLVAEVSRMVEMDLSPYIKEIKTRDSA